MLDSAAPYYQAGLGNRLCYELTFNDYNRVTIGYDNTNQCSNGLVGGYHSKFVNDFINLFGEGRTVVELLMDCQKWVWSQNCEIIKKLYHT